MVLHLLNKFTQSHVMLSLLQGRQILSNRLCLTRTLKIKKVTYLASPNHGALRLNESRIAVTSCYTINHKSKTCTQEKGLSTQCYGFVNSCRTFHTTPRKYVHPVFIIIGKQFLKLGAILVGRNYRKVLKEETPEAKKKRWKHFAYFGLALTGILIVHYVGNLQETPVTHRKRFVSFTPEQFMKIAAFERDLHVEQYKDIMVDFNHTVYKRICNIAQCIVNSNQDIEIFKKQKWTVFVIDEPSINAFVLPTGEIFVHTGLMTSIMNDHQLAAVIAHEMAHAVLGHGAEQLSYTHLVDWLVIFSLAMIWAFMPSDGIAFVTQWFYNKVVQLLLTMPYSRKLETEADEVGLQFMAKACYDPRESSNFWNLMSIRDMQEGQEQTKWLSTHPTHDQRADDLDNIIPKVLAMREECRCPPLRRDDPRLEMKALKHMVETNTLIPLLTEAPRPSHGEESPQKKAPAIS